MRVNQRTLIFTEACPLDCRYCFSKSSENYLKGVPFTLDEMKERIASYYETDQKNGMITEMLFSGGEPFLYWDSYIKPIMDLWGNKIRYKFNTSGVLLTPDIIEYLSHFTVSFTLSCDGDDKLTNYLRPYRENKYRVGYMKKFREMIPYLLYYFPNTPFRIIIGPRYIDKLYETYLYAEQLGFKYFTFILDFNSRTYGTTVKGYGIPWEDKYTEQLTEQTQLIAQEIIEGWRQGLERTQVNEFNTVVQHLLNNQPFDPQNLPCQVLNGRTLSTVFNRDNTYCMTQYFPTEKELEDALNEQYAATGGVCPLDPECPAFSYCALHCCPKNSYIQYNEFFHTEVLECALNKAVYAAVVPMLMTANLICKNSYYYFLYLKEMGGMNYGSESTNSVLSMASESCKL